MQLLTGIILVLAILAVVYIIIALLIYITQEGFFFYPTKLSPDYPFEQFPEHEEVFFNTPNEGKINGLFFKSDQSKGLVLYSHGNSRSLDDWGLVHRDFVSLGYDCLIYDYRTFGKSTGKLNEKNFYGDIRYILEQMRKKYSDDKIVLYGRSLGCSIATQMATEFKTKCLILETPFSSMLSMVHASTPFVPAKYLLRYKFNNKRKMRILKCPVHIMHGTADELIPMKHAQRLKRANKHPDSTLSIIEDGTHNNLSEFDTYHENLARILA